MSKLLVLLGCALYTLSPIDLIPDFIPVLGWLDDVGVIAFAIHHLTRAQTEVRERRERPQARPVRAALEE